jgi:general secretion pathway protein N
MKMVFLSLAFVISSAKAMAAAIPTSDFQAQIDSPVELSRSSEEIGLRSQEIGSRLALPVSAMINGNPLWRIPLDTLSSTRQRPIFSPSRRPPPAPVAAAAPAPQRSAPAPVSEPEQPRLTLLGTIIGGDVSIAIFRDQVDETVVRLHLGDGRRGWKLLSVRDRAATVRNSESIELSLPARTMALSGSPAPKEPAAATAVPESFGPATPNPTLETQAVLGVGALTVKKIGTTSGITTVNIPGVGALRLRGR